MHRIRFAILVLALAICGVPLHAQMESGFGTGDRVRLHVPEAFRNPVVGTVVENAGGSLTLARDVGDRADTVNIPLVMIRSVDVSRGHHSRAGAVRRGALVGAGAGLMVGAVFGGVQAMGADEFGGSGVNEAAESGKFALRFGALGLVAGALSGLRVSERWERLPLPPFSLSLQGRSPSLTLSLKL